MRMRKAWLTVLAILVGCADATSPASENADLSVRSIFSAVAPEAVLPSAYATIMGNSNTNFPHAGHRQLRYQQVFNGSDLVDPVIVSLCLRRDDVSSSSARTKFLTIKLGPTALDYTNLKAAFDSNYSAPPTVVFSDTVQIPAALAGGTPVDFDLCIPFTQAYEHPAGSNLIVEVVNTSADLGPAPRDACENAAGCTTSKVYALNSNAITGFREAGGLVMKLVSPLPPAPDDPTTHEECFKGGWSEFEFRNQGQCIRFVETGEDSRAPSP
jgi:hypothetical protein